MEKQVLSDIRYSKTAIIVMGIGIICTLAIAFLVSYFDMEEYPKLLNQDSLADIVQSVNKDRRGSFVTFQSNKKLRIPWAQNFRYEDFSSLTEVISIGDLIMKEPLSDTIIVKHKGTEYLYVLEQVIQK